MMAKTKRKKSKKDRDSGAQGKVKIEVTFYTDVHEGVDPKTVLKHAPDTLDRQLEDLQGVGGIYRWAITDVSYRKKKKRR